MIRINLLPVRAAKKKESVRLQFTIAGLVVFLCVSVTFIVYLTLRGEASALSTSISNGEQELGQLKLKIGELSKIKEQKKIVESKLDIINELEKARTGPANFFKMLSDSVPERAWVASIKDDGRGIALKGYASTDEDVAECMRSLAKYTAVFEAVDLEVAQRVVESETKTDVVAFTLRLEKVKPPEEKKTDKDKDKDKEKK
ncbi:MAG: PilN domain-containing protein [Deltaproteobacteria bacterium]|nr:PilN domain-containing protein [Deltaproteobacteria bacterium]